MLIAQVINKYRTAKPAIQINENISYPSPSKQLIVYQGHHHKVENVLKHQVDMLLIL